MSPKAGALLNTAPLLDSAGGKPFFTPFHKLIGAPIAADESTNWFPGIALIWSMIGLLLGVTVGTGIGLTGGKAF